LKKKIIIFSSLFVLIILVILGVGYYKKSTRNTIEKIIDNKQMINVLITGNNVFNENKHRFYAIISINPENKNIGVTFIPPEFKIEDDDKKSYKIEDAVVFNYNKVRYSLQKSLGLDIPYYLELYAVDVSKIVNLIEGINLFILKPDEIKGHFKFGINYLDGKKVLSYINSVENNSIYLKYDKIQDILLTIYYDQRKIARLNNFDFIKIISNDIKTNLLPQEFLKIVSLILKKGNFYSTLLPGEFKDGFYILDKLSSNIYREIFLTQLILSKNNKVTPKIKILNGTKIHGLARKMRNKLIREGFNVVEFGTSPYPKLKKSIIISRKGTGSLVKKVSDFTGITNIYYKIDSTVLNNVLIIIGEDLVR